MTSPWAAVLILVGVVIVAIFLIAWFRNEHMHGPGCPCRDCGEANLKDAFRQHQEDEHKRKGGWL